MAATLQKKQSLRLSSSILEDIDDDSRYAQVKIEPLSLNKKKDARAKDEGEFDSEFSSPQSIIFEPITEAFENAQDMKILNAKQVLAKKVQEMNQLLQKKQQVQQNQQNQKQKNVPQDEMWPFERLKSKNSYERYMAAYLRYISHEEKELGANTIANMQLGRNFRNSCPNIHNSGSAKTGKKRVTFNHFIDVISFEVIDIHHSDLS